MNRPPFLGRAGDRGVGRTAIAATGYAAVVLAALTAFVPGVGEAIAGSIGLVVGSPVSILLAGLVGGGYGLFQLYRTGRTESKRSPLVARNPERAHYGEDYVAGAEIDDSIDAIGGELPESAAKDWWTYREKSDVKAAMRKVTVDVLAREHDVSRDAAARMIDAGSWTDDERAATFLGGDRAGSVPLRVQFFDWLSGAAYERRVTATVDVVASRAGLERAPEEEPSRVGASVERPDDGSDEPDPKTADSTRRDWSVTTDEHDSLLDDDEVEGENESTPEPLVEATDPSAEPDDGNEGERHVAWTGGDDE